MKHLRSWFFELLENHLYFSNGGSIDTGSNIAAGVKADSRKSSDVDGIFAAQFQVLSTKPHSIPELTYRECVSWSM